MKKLLTEIEENRRTLIQMFQMLSTAGLVLDLLDAHRVSQISLTAYFTPRIKVSFTTNKN